MAKSPAKNKTVRKDTTKRKKTMNEFMLFKALREFTSGLLNQLLVNLAGKDGQIWYEEFKKFLRREPCWVGDIKVYLRKIFKVEIGATDDTETFISSGLFEDGIKYDERELRSPTPSGESTPAVKLNVWELVLDGSYAQFFGSLGKAGEGELTQSQICQFIREHRDKLRKRGYATFFRLEGGFVARVFVSSNTQLSVRVGQFSSRHICQATSRFRVVSMQQ